jgi:2-polyprenyl-3-methyl-5-hydroxy-6-metoxy-1,4-benzoquinol methylase
MAILMDPEGHEIAALEVLAPLDGAHVLEIGCGDGRLTRRYSSRAAHVVAIDPDGSAIAMLQGDPPAGSVDARACSVERLEQPNASFDVVILSWAL